MPLYAQQNSKITRIKTLFIQCNRLTCSQITDILMEHENLYYRRRMYQYVSSTLSKLVKSGYLKKCDEFGENFANVYTLATTYSK